MKPMNIFNKFIGPENQRFSENNGYVIRGKII